MTRLFHLIKFFVFESIAISRKAMLMLFIFFSISFVAKAQIKNNFKLNINFTGKDSLFDPVDIKFQTAFINEQRAYEYVNKLPELMASQGYPLASIDSIWASESALNILLYPGTRYILIKLSTSFIEKKALSEIGYNENSFLNKPINIAGLQKIQNKLINYYQKNGFPFATAYLDSLKIENNTINALLKIDKGILYNVDSIRVYGNINLNKNFLQRYLNISNGSAYNIEKLNLVDKRMLELLYLSPVQPSDVTMLGTGAILNLYVQPKKSNRADFLIGYLPSANKTGKGQFTGDVNLNFKNLFGSGEGILLKWQQIQPKSPRLNLGYAQPYIFNSSFGTDFLFDLFKKDSSFLQLNAQLGIPYLLSANQSAKIFIQWQNTNMLLGSVDTNIIKAIKTLPPNIDVKSTNMGLNYEWNKTDYRYNPRKGNEMNVTASIGIKNIKPNNEIVNLKDPLFNYASLYDSIKGKSYQLKIKFSAAHFFQTGKSSVLKVELNGGLYNSPNIFRNEVFQIGGYNLLRGFDEESIFATKYLTSSAEYRYITGLNSYLFFFIDQGIVKNQYQSIDFSNYFTSAGIGLVYESKGGLLNLSYALGKRNDLKFNLREASKLHFGYINYF